MARSRSRTSVAPSIKAAHATFSPGSRSNVMRSGASTLRILEPQGWISSTLAWTSAISPSRLEKPKPPPINAKGETAAKLPMFREAFARRRCILPIDGFYEWRAIKGAKVKEPYAIAMKDRSPFGLAGLWENWKELATGEWIRTFCVITVPANEMVSAIHDRMPAILRPGDYDAWLAGDGTQAKCWILPIGADNDVAHLNASELAEERRRRAARSGRRSRRQCAT